MLLQVCPERKWWRSHGEERRVVRGEEWGLTEKQGSDRRVGFEFLVEELSYLLSVPTFGMDEIRVKGEVAVVKVAGDERPGVVAIDRKVEDGEIDEVNKIMVTGYEVERFPCAGRRLLRRAEEEVDVT